MRLELASRLGLELATRMRPELARRLGPECGHSQEELAGSDRETRVRLVRLLG